MKKVVIVTGASRGIGKEIAVLLAEQGEKVVINYSSNTKAATATVNEITKKGGNAISIKADVSKKEEVVSLFNKTIAHYGNVDVLINNAGLLVMQFLKDATEKEFEDLFNVNVKGVFNTMQESFTKLSDNGSIINITSSTVKLMLPKYALYSATKAAVEQMTRVFSKEIGRGISVNAIAPGPTNTELFLEGKSEEFIQKLISQNVFGRIAEPSDIAKVVLFMVSNDSSWITGQIIPVNGGMV